MFDGIFCYNACIVLEFRLESAYTAQQTVPLLLCAIWTHDFDGCVVAPKLIALCIRCYFTLYGKCRWEKNTHVCWYIYYSVGLAIHKAGADYKISFLAYTEIWLDNCKHVC